MKRLMLLFGLLLPSLAMAQQYSINWYKISGGGGTSTNGQYSLSGTIGQPDASAAMTGGNYSLTGGFWSMIALVQTVGSPTLSIALSGNNVTISWPVSATGFTLQTNRTIGSTNWGNYIGSVNNNSTVVSPPSGNLFFRLTHP